MKWMPFLTRPELVTHQPSGLVLGWRDQMLSFFFFFCLFRAASMVYGGSQARGQIGAVAAGLHHSHGNARSEPRL